MCSNLEKQYIKEYIIIIIRSKELLPHCERSRELLPLHCERPRELLPQVPQAVRTKDQGNCCHKCPQTLRTKDQGNCCHRCLRP